MTASLICPRCDWRAGVGDEVRYACESCGWEALDVALDDLSGAVDEGDQSLWRYRAWLPVKAPGLDAGPLRHAGMTPLMRMGRTARELGMRGRLWIKDDGLLPTGSLKDRASAVVVMRALGLGVERVVTASTGNAGVALAAMARAADLPAVVIVPASAPPAKLAQIGVFGATLVPVDGNYDAAFALAKAAATELGWYCRNTAYNPFTVEGKKTVSFEICEQLAMALGERGFRAPDRIYVSVGDGNIITGVHKGLRDLFDSGRIDRMPRLFGAQSLGSAAISNAFAAGADVVAPVSAATVADSIAADAPADGWRALRAVRETGGAMLTVSDEAIIAAIAELGRRAAVFAEPAAAAAFAALVTHSDDIEPDEEVVLLSTGNGLKDVAAASRAVAIPAAIAPDVAALADFVS